MDECGRGEERAEPKDKPLDLPVNLRSYSYLWSRSLSSDQKNEIAGKMG